MLPAFYSEPVAVRRFIAWENLALMLPGGLFHGVVYEIREPTQARCAAYSWLAALRSLSNSSNRIRLLAACATG